MSDRGLEPPGAAAGSTDAERVAATTSKRRFLFLGAAAGSAVALASASGAQAAVTGASPAAGSGADPLPERGGGYRLSDHVKHYYRTTAT